ncbi:hypothetical protein M569_09064, partial [Genlisea aurea]
PRLSPMKLSCSRNHSYNPPLLPFTSEQAVLDAVAELDASENALPAVRTFENDLARLTLIGAVDFNQALTAAAADGGETADQHLSSGMPAMVVEALFPGSTGDHSTISTRLFLPAGKVKEKAMKLKKSLGKTLLNVTDTKNILAMTFRQVVLQKIWSFELALFSPRTEKNMNDLENRRELSSMLTLTASDERILSDIGEVVCIAALQTTQRHAVHDSATENLNGLFGWLKNHKQISSKDSSVYLLNFLENEVLSNASTLLEKFNVEREQSIFMGRRWKNIWWSSPAFSKLQTLGGPDFCAWISESVPSYTLRIDDKIFSGLKFDGWRNSQGNTWEADLTHSQMVSLACILDMYYEDVFTLPNKKLLCHAVAKSSSSASVKGNSLFYGLSSIVVAGIFLVAVNILKRRYIPHRPVQSIYSQEDSQSSDVKSTPSVSLESSEFLDCCVGIVSRIKDCYGWHGDIHTNSESGDSAWIGEVPAFLTTTGADNTSVPSNATLEDICSYRVTLSGGDRRVVGFEPMSRAGVNNWAGNPLAKELYGFGLRPGLLEWGLKKRYPSGGVLVFELLMSVNSASSFALVR